MRESFDVIVAGAGPAGSMAARECAKQGLKTILVEKEKIPRSKTCGGAVSIKAINLVGERIPEYLIEEYIRGFRFFSPSLDSVDVISKDPIGISTSRDRFDEFLVKLAMYQGCEFVDSDGVIDASVSYDKVICRLRSGRLIQGHILIGSDGANGIIAQRAGIREKWKKDQVGLCLETRIPLDKGKMKNLDSEIYELYLIDVPLGYGWVLPKRSSISVGIGGCLAYLRKPQEILRDFCQTVSMLKKIDIKISELRAHLVPAGGFRRGIVTERVMLAGDAAGFIDPLSGEGIYYAMKSGLLAANACKKAVEEGDVSTSFLEAHYSKICEKSFGKDLQIALALTYKIHDDFALFFDLLMNNPDSLWLDLARGDITYTVLRRKLLPSLVVKFINKKLRSLLHIDRKRYR